MFMFVIYQFFHNILNIKNILISILFPYFKIYNLTDSEVNMGVIMGKLMLMVANELVREGVVICDYLMKECQHILQKRNKKKK